MGTQGRLGRAVAAPALGQGCCVTVGPDPERTGRWQETQQPALAHGPCFCFSVCYERESPGETDTPAARGGALGLSFLCTQEGGSPPRGLGSPLCLAAGEPGWEDWLGACCNEDQLGPAPHPGRGEGSHRGAALRTAPGTLALGLSADDLPISQWVLGRCV